MSSTSTKPHAWKFFRVSGLDQVALRSGEDLLNLKYLDQKLWVALSCPVRGLQLDEKTLTLIDTDKNGRIRVPEILNAIDWLAPRLKTLDPIVEPKGDLPLSLINDATPEGKLLLASAHEILASLGKKDSPTIGVADAADPDKFFAATVFNGDGVVIAEATNDAALKQTIADIISIYGSEKDRSGKPGINQPKVDQFFQDLAAYVTWRSAGADVQILGAGTADAYAAWKTVRAKVDDYFARCNLASFDPRALTALNRQESEYLVVASKDLALSTAEMTGFPIARVESGRPLPLTQGVNPAWREALENFRARVIAPWFGTGKITLTADEWVAIETRFAPYEKWQAARPASSVEKLGDARIEELKANNEKAALDDLIARDLKLAPEASAVSDVERLARYYRDFGVLLRSFVNFADFSRPDRRATFQAGTLYLDSRSCDLCVRVEDPSAHTVLASLSKCYIAYCDLTHVSGETMKIAACFTQGDSDYLMVGRNGLFYDREGRDWDATITKIIDNPISLRQAFWSPYKKFVRLIGEQAAKRAAAAESAADSKLASLASATTTPATPPPAPAPKRIDVGAVAALGVALGALTTAFAYILGFFKGLPWWEVPLVFLGVMALISGGSVAIAWLKLRQRTLGPILDANGWAVNGRVRINLPFGTSLTQRPKFPPGSTHQLKDPFHDSSGGKFWTIAIVIVLLAAGGYGYYAHQTGRWPFEPAPQPKSQPAAPDPIEKKTG